MKKHINQNFELDFLWEVSRTLILNFTPEEIVFGLKNLFKKFFDITEFKIILYDKSANTLRDFRKDWTVVTGYNSNRYFEIFQKLSSSVRTRFILNDMFFILNDDFDALGDFKVKQSDNKLYIPIVKHTETIGMIEIFLNEINNKFLTPSFLKALTIATTDISAVIINYNLTRKITRNSNFYLSLKNIAKILESQYDFSYVIPLIGEIVDKFAGDYFVYIFMKENGKLKLMWPSSYDKEKISYYLHNAEKTKTFALSDDKTVCVFPVYFDKEYQGAIVVDGKNMRISSEDVEYFYQLTKQAAITLDKASVYAEIQKYATMDALTGLNNRRSLDIKIKQEIAVTKRKKSPLCVVMIDIDFFKQINDTYGHSVGDVVLKEFADLIRAEIREYDFPCRYGGEEFFLILPISTLSDALLVANRLRKRIEDHEINIEKTMGNVIKLKITASFGVAEYTKEMTPEKLYECADVALYEAKHSGRNKVVIFQN